LMPLDSQTENTLLTQVPPKVHGPKFSTHGQFFRVSRSKNQFHGSDEAEPMQWETDWKDSAEQQHPPPLAVDYTQEDRYEYTTPLSSLPLHGKASSEYPMLRSFRELLQDWPLEAIDHPPTPIREVLAHFDIGNATQVAMAQKLQAQQVPFKYVNVPELLEANEKWTDDYVSSEFDAKQATVQGKCQESPHAFFVFFQPPLWNVERMGLPPTRNNDWRFETWAQHAQYADATRLSADQPHFYWQAGVPPEEREMPTSQWSFISKDLPSFSSPNATLFCPQPSEQKGIQCRFGERGVTAATHYDAGQNYIGMISGAKRYILHPPNQCSKLGIVPHRESSLFRHSPLYFGKTSSEDPLEQAWLDRAGSSLAVETVLKQGEVLFVPSHWFHSIVGLQKNAQCNVRSGVQEGSEVYGGADDISEHKCRA